MNCPKCGNKELRVVDSRSFATRTRRRRQCMNCGYRFTTYEISEVQVALFEKAERIRSKLAGKIGELEKVVNG